MNQNNQWTPGVPPRTWCDDDHNDWFVAKLKNGHYTCLHALPEEYAYQWKTMDETYIMTKSVVAWAELPLEEIKKDD